MGVIKECAWPRPVGVFRGKGRVKFGKGRDQKQGCSQVVKSHSKGHDHERD